ncbi:FAD/NAD(P)-binding oxidoreductase [Pseudorhodoferax sp.]|uniref:FAD/NAD(P)-binding oxidoreductase n=1 Tax=Pseudorhodoferax sp. TaxID=1993553 RepID=UPI001B69A949|nr:FAD/NAD(P)-binding oxidoreductase [Pseudorhodoferax sp.]MBP8145794.1 FAD-dependent oxidoreductase [Inhella sp.]
MHRRQILRAAAAASTLATGAALPWSARAALGISRPAGSVLIVGGGMAGATLAKYLRLWSGGRVGVTLVEREAHYTSCIMSSLVLTGQRSLASLNFSHAALAKNHGVTLRRGEVVALDAERPAVQLADGNWLTADRIVLAPGIEFDPVAGLSDPLAMPHAWKAGEQTAALARQLQALPPRGRVLLTIPKVPYRCPPGPYERACLIADWLRQHKPQSRLTVLDANADFVVERDNFSEAFFGLHGDVIDYHTSVEVQSVDQDTHHLYTNQGAFQAEVVNLIPRQRAPALLGRAGLLNSPDGRFAAVNMLSYASTAAPKVHVLGDASHTPQPKAGHIANQEAKVCADALIRGFNGLPPDPAPVTNSACFSTITQTQASWLHALFQYDPARATMVPVAAAGGASNGWNGDHFEAMGTWFRALMADSFA